MRELCSGLTLFLMDESQVSARHGSGPRSAEAFKRYIPLWGSVRAERVLYGRDGGNIFLSYSRLLPVQLTLTKGSAFMDMLEFSFCFDMGLGTVYGSALFSGPDQCCCSACSSDVRSAEGHMKVLFTVR